MARVFSQKHSSTFVVNDSIQCGYRKCVSDRTIWQNRMFYEYLVGRPYPRVTRETQLSSSILTLHILVMCRAHASLRRMLSRELSAKTLQSSICLSRHTLSLTQPVQLNPTINTRYKRLNKITIEFSTELKPTKHIVVNYKFTDLGLSTYIKIEI